MNQCLCISTITQQDLHKLRHLGSINWGTCRPWSTHASGFKQRCFCTDLHLALIRSHEPAQRRTVGRMPASLSPSLSLSCALHLGSLLHISYHLSQSLNGLGALPCEEGRAPSPLLASLDTCLLESRNTWTSDMLLRLLLELMECRMNAQKRSGTSNSSDKQGGTRGVGKHKCSFQHYRALSASPARAQGPKLHTTLKSGML